MGDTNFDMYSAMPSFLGDSTGSYKPFKFSDGNNSGNGFNVFGNGLAESSIYKPIQLQQFSPPKNPVSSSFNSGAVPGTSISDYSPTTMNSFTSSGSGKNQVTPSSGFNMKELFGDEHMMGNITGLAGSLMQMASLSTMLKNAKLQNKSLAFNLATAQKEQQRRDNNISSFNNYSSPTDATPNKSAFA